MAGEKNVANGSAIDRLGKLYIEPTNRCNLDCRTCMRQGWEEGLGFMEFGLFQKIMADPGPLSGNTDVFFGGFGEPLAHPRIVDMVALAKQGGSGVELISNGILLDAKMIDRLVAAGLDRLWVSIDGASPQSYADVRLGDHLPEIIANLERLKTRNRKPELGISFVAMRRNIADLPAVVELAVKLGASRFSLSNVEPYTEDMKAEMLYGRVLFAELSEGGCVMPRFDPGAIDVRTRAALSACFPSTLSFTPLAPGRKGICPFLQRRSASVRWDGRIGPCLPLLHAHTVCLNGQPRTWPEFTLGSLGEHGLVEIWNDPEYRDFRRKLEEFVFAPCTTCNSCDLPDVNNEDCFGNVHPACGGCLWSQGFIQCP
ncbi:MAG TPA: radical SAM protein [Candidatus Binatia bacterium]|nr:radical SAM protein [Candidatus Binatia bacterium]